MLRSLAVLMALAPAVMAAAQMPMTAPAEEACPTTPTAPPADLAGWQTPVPLAAAKSPGDLARATLPIGQRVEAALIRTADVRYAVQPEKPGGSMSYGGFYAFTVATAGTYRVALASGAWIDVLKGKTPIASTAHGHGPACSGIRKMVDFPLRPGRYVLQIAANGAPTLGVMVAKRP